MGPLRSFVALAAGGGALLAAAAPASAIDISTQPTPLSCTWTRGAESLGTFDATLALKTGVSQDQLHPGDAIVLRATPTSDALTLTVSADTAARLSGYGPIPFGVSFRSPDVDFGSLPAIDISQRVALGPFTAGQTTYSASTDGFPGYKGLLRTVIGDQVRLSDASADGYFGSDSANHLRCVSTEPDRVLATIPVTPPAAPAAPSVTGLSAGFVQATGGEPVTISGEFAGRVTAVQVGGEAVPFTQLGYRGISITTKPVPVSSDPIPLTVTTTGGKTTVPGFSVVPGSDSNHVVVTTPLTCTTAPGRFEAPAARLVTALSASPLTTGDPVRITTQSYLQLESADWPWASGLNFPRFSRSDTLGAFTATGVSRSAAGDAATGGATYAPVQPGSSAAEVFGPRTLDFGTVAAGPGGTITVAPTEIDTSFSGSGSSSFDGLGIALYGGSVCKPSAGAKPATFTVAGSPTPASFTSTLAASATVSNAFSRGKLPLAGSFAASVGTDGTLTGAVALDPATLRLTALGVIPVTAAATFKPQAAGLVTGTLKGDVLHLTSDYRLLLKSVRLFGLALQTSTACGALTTLTLDSATGFTAAGLGPVKGSVAIGALTSCGSFTPLLTALIQGRGTFATTLVTR